MTTEYVPLSRNERAEAIKSSANRLHKLCALEAPNIIIEMERALLFKKLMAFPVDADAHAMRLRVAAETYSEQQEFLFANGFYRDVTGDGSEAGQSA